MTAQLVHQAEDFRISDFDFRSLTERDLARLWRDQTFPPQALVTSAGERLRVVYRGRPGGGAGPDFRDALIAAPRGLLRGDVELHVRSSDFRRHGHDRDPAYAGVVLHLVFHDDEHRPTPLPGGGLAVVVALGDWARDRAAEIERWLARPALWREPCFSALPRLGAAEVAAALERLGEMRLRQKAAAFARRLGEMGNEKWERRKQEEGRSLGSAHLPSSAFLLPDSAEQILWEALLEALTFGNAGEEFGLLARRLPWAELRRRLAPLPARERAGEARRLLAALAGEVLTSLAGRGRPAGRPEKRLRGAAQLAARFADGGLLTAFLHLLEGESRNSKPAEANCERAKTENRKRTTEIRARPTSSHEGKAIASLVAALVVPGLIGRSRAVEMLGNAVLPFLAALGPEARTRRAEALYRRLPLPARYGVVRHLHEALGNENRKTENENRPDDFRRGAAASGAGVRVDFRRQQGMLYLLKHYCTQGGCGRCPLS